MVVVVKSNFNPSIDLINWEMASFIPFRDIETCKRVAKIRKEDLCKHPNPEFKIRILPISEFHLEMALDILTRIRKAAEEDKPFVGIFPVGPIFQYPILAKIVNALNVSLKHVHFFFMDEYADDKGNDINPEWPGSFHYTMNKVFFSQIKPDLRPPKEQIHFPSKENIEYYDDLIREARGERGAKGANICYGGTGLSGHLAFWDPHLAYEYDSLEDWKKAGPRLVELHPISIMQMTFTDMNGAWAFVPPKAYTIGPAQVLNADYRGWWNDGCGMTWKSGYVAGLTWQKFIIRLAAHGPVTPLVPCSILQTVSTDFVIIEPLAEDVTIEITA
jgi:glucosamine-6-phosphate deaminase